MIEVEVMPDGMAPLSDLCDFWARKILHRRQPRPVVTIVLVCFCWYGIFVRSYSTPVKWRCLKLPLVGLDVIDRVVRDINGVLSGYDCEQQVSKSWSDWARVFGIGAGGVTVASALK